MAQFFVGKETLVCDAYGMKSQINKLYDNIKSRGAMNTIITDDGKYEISKKVADLLRSLLSNNMNQNHTTNTKTNAEQCYGVVIRHINTLMNLTGAQPIVAYYVYCMSAAI